MTHRKQTETGDTEARMVCDQLLRVQRRIDRISGGDINPQGFWELTTSRVMDNGHWTVTYLPRPDKSALLYKVPYIFRDCN